MQERGKTRFSRKKTRYTLNKRVFVFQYHYLYYNINKLFK